MHIDEPDRSDETPVVIPVLLEDSWFLVVNKPVHLLTQAPDGIPSLQAQLLAQFSREGGPKPFIGIPHRLDRMTSGSVVIARNQRALRRLCDQFAARTIDKIYLAWVHGTPKPSDTFVDSMRKVENEPRAEIVDPSEEGSRTASLSYRVLGTRTGLNGQSESLVEVQLGTGRMHQIRLQFASRGYSILGDSLYGSEVSWGDRPEYFRESPMALHAATLSFAHPKTAERILVRAPVPAGYPWGTLAEEFSCARGGDGNGN